MIHLEGLGAIGSLTALWLESEGIEFTWSDAYKDHVAWKACSGAVFPTGDTFDRFNLLSWKQMAKGDSLFANSIKNMSERADWCYITKEPPHKGAQAGVEAKREIGPIKISNKQSFHLDIPKLVFIARLRFDKQEKEPEKKSKIVVTHGFTKFLHRYGWGWTAEVDASFPEEMNGKRRPCLYLRKDYRLRYLYPRAGGNTYYAGTDKVLQASPNSLDIQERIKAFKKYLKESTDNLVKIKEVKHYEEGWRPVPIKDLELIERRKKSDKIYLRPMGGNGIRHFPALLGALMEEL